MLRDYHSPNLMWLGDGRVGVLDFQDAMRGPWAYDVVSLLQDARLDVPEAVERDLLAHYRREVAQREPDFDPAAFDYAYAALGAQRNTKLLGIFTRLAKRDSNSATSPTSRASGATSNAISATPPSPISPMVRHPLPAGEPGKKLIEARGAQEDPARPFLTLWS